MNNREERENCTKQSRNNKKQSKNRRRRKAEWQQTGQTPEVQKHEETDEECADSSVTLSTRHLDTVAHSPVLMGGRREGE